MKTIVMLKWDNFSKRNYETLRKSVDWENDSPHGLAFHTAGFDHNTLRVTDIWESAEDFNNFVKTRLEPAAKKAGIETRPDVEMVPVYAIHSPVPDMIYL